MRRASSHRRLGLHLAGGDWTVAAFGNGWPCPLTNRTENYFSRSAPRLGLLRYICMAKSFMLLIVVSMCTLLFLLLVASLA